MPIWGYDGSSWRRAKGVWGYDGSSWRKAKDVWGYDGSSWRKAINSVSTSNTGSLTWNQVFRYGNSTHASWNTSARKAVWGAYSGYTNYVGWLNWCYSNFPNYNIATSVTNTALRVVRGDTGSYGSALPARFGSASANYNSSRPSDCFNNSVSTNRFWITGNMTAGANAWKDIKAVTSYHGTILNALKAGNWVVTQQWGTQTSAAYGSLTCSGGTASYFNVTYTYNINEFMLTPNIQSMYSPSRMFQREIPDEYMQYLKPYYVNDGVQYSVYATEDEIKNILGNKTIDNSHEVDIMDLFRYREDVGHPNYHHSKLIAPEYDPFVDEIYAVDREDGSKRFSMTVYNMDGDEDYIIEYSTNGGEWKIAYYESPNCYMGDLLTQTDAKNMSTLLRSSSVTVSTRISKAKSIMLMSGKTSKDSDVVYQNDFRVEVGGNLHA